ncbi:unnamed protein product [Rhizophagus irregularis]|nr:unnamed protein product [Rhizophagus irregularis]
MYIDIIQNQLVPVEIIPIYFNYTACGIIEDNGKVIHARNDLDLLHSVRAKMILDNNYIFEWDVIIERGFNGNCRSSGVNIGNYCPSFGDGTKLCTVQSIQKYQHGIIYRQSFIQ